MKINKSPVLTTVNYGINDFEFDQKIEYTSKKFENFSIKNAKNCKFTVNYSILSPEFLIKQNHNFCASLVITKSQTEPIILQIEPNKDNNVLVDYINITAENFVNASVIIKYVSNTKVYCNSLINVNVTENANLDVTVVCELDNQSTNLIKFTNLVQENSNLTYKIIDFCSLYSVQNFSSKVEEKSNSNLSCIYLGNQNSKVDINYVQDVVGAKAVANITCIGALNHFAEKSFKGTINFVKGAKAAKGTENELCLLLSPNAKSKALPMLLCGEEDVDGSHSSSVGKISDKELFYINSRGIDKKEAVKIYVKAKFNSVLNNIDKQLKEEIIEKIDKELDNE